MTNTFQYTLLIVESPSIANIIRNFKIPFLEIIPTNGFCWKPVYDFKKQKLTYRADPNKRNLRKLLKSKAQWASKIIIATDTDSSGEFIAFTTWKYLKDFDVHRAYLHNLSKKAIEELLNENFPFEHKNFHPLVNRYIVNNLLENDLKQRLGPMVWIKLLTMMYWHNEYRDSNLLKIPKNAKYPWNTADILEKLSYSYNSMIEAQKSLNDLFTLIPEDLEHGVISYPRTTAHGYYQSTWVANYQKWILNKPSESFKPEPIWEKVDRNIPHESIQPINTTITPLDVRPLMRKKYYDLYKMIYEHHLQVIQMPDLRKKENSDHHYSSKKNSGKSQYVKLSDYLSFLTKYQAAKPSGYGLLLDRLVNSRWLHIQNGYVSPEIEMIKTIQSIKDLEPIKDGLIFLKNGITDNFDWPDAKLFSHIKRIINTL